MAVAKVDVYGFNGGFITGSPDHVAILVSAEAYTAQDNTDPATNTIAKTILYPNQFLSPLDRDMNSLLVSQTVDDIQTALNA